MALNLIEDNHLTYHDRDGDTLRADAYPKGIVMSSDGHTMVFVDRDAVETLRDCLTRWLEMGKFTTPTTIATPNEGA